MATFLDVFLFVFLATNTILFLFVKLFSTMFDGCHDCEKYLFYGISNITLFLQVFSRHVSFLGQLVPLILDYW